MNSRQYIVCLYHIHADKFITLTFETGAAIRLGLDMSLIRTQRSRTP